MWVLQMARSAALLAELTYQRLKDVEDKFNLVVEWVNSALPEDPEDEVETMIPAINVHPAGQADDDDDGDFNPGQGRATGAEPTGIKGGALNLSRSRMSRAHLSSADLASFNDKFGSLTLSGAAAKRGRGLAGFTGLGGKSLREESSYMLSEELDEIF